MVITDQCSICSKEFLCYSKEVLFSKITSNLLDIELEIHIKKDGHKLEVCRKCTISLLKIFLEVELSDGLAKELETTKLEK